MGWKADASAAALKHAAENDAPEGHGWVLVHFGMNMSKNMLIQEGQGSPGWSAEEVSEGSSVWIDHNGRLVSYSHTQRQHSPSWESYDDVSGPYDGMSALAASAYTRDRQVKEETWPNGKKVTTKTYELTGAAPTHQKILSPFNSLSNEPTPLPDFTPEPAAEEPTLYTRHSSHGSFIASESWRAFGWFAQTLTVGFVGSIVSLSPPVADLHHELLNWHDVPSTDLSGTAEGSVTAGLMLVVFLLARAFSYPIRFNGTTVLRTAVLATGAAVMTGVATMWLLKIPNDSLTEQLVRPGFAITAAAGVIAPRRVGWFLLLVIVALLGSAMSMFTPVAELHRELLSRYDVSVLDLSSRAEIGVAAFVLIVMVCSGYAIASLIILVDTADLARSVVVAVTVAIVVGVASRSLLDVPSELVVGKLLLPGCVIAAVCGVWLNIWTDEVA